MNLWVLVAAAGSPLSVVLAAVSAYWAWRAFAEIKAIDERAASPSIKVFTEFSPDSPSCLDLVILNAGGSAAHEVRIAVLNDKHPIIAKSSDPKGISKVLEAGIPYLEAGMANRLRLGDNFVGPDQSWADSPLQINLAFKIADGTAFDSGVTVAMRHSKYIFPPPS